MRTKSSPRPAPVFFPSSKPGIRGSRSGSKARPRRPRSPGRPCSGNFLLGLAAVFLLLCFQFRNYVEPILVMAVIPAGLVGVIWGHYALGLELSMPSMVGFASLAGWW